jgi:hypothetical protein
VTSGTHAIVWSQGHDLYTHQDESGNTILYSLEELLRDGVPTWDQAPDSLPAPEDGQVAVPLSDLNEFLGL